jgi:sugar phosphate isomerase/epimerase
LFVKSASDRVGVLLNIGHLTTLGQEGWRLIEEMPERLPVVAWKDHSVQSDRPFPVYSIELGTGDSPFGDYVAALKRTPGGGAGHTHIINVEHAPAGQEIPALKRSLTYLQTLWRQTDDMPQ